MHPATTSTPRRTRSVGVIVGLAALAAAAPGVRAASWNDRATHATAAHPCLLPTTTTSRTHTDPYDRDRATLAVRPAAPADVVHVGGGGFRVRVCARGAGVLIVKSCVRSRRFVIVSGPGAWMPVWTSSRVTRRGCLTEAWLHPQAGGTLRVRILDV